MSLKEFDSLDELLDVTEGLLEASEEMLEYIESAYNINNKYTVGYDIVNNLKDAVSKAKGE